MSESLRNDGRIWVPLKKGDKRHPSQIPEGERDYYLERTLSELRQPGAARRGLAQRQGGLRRGPRRGRTRPRRLPGFPRRHPAPGQAGRSRSATATCSTCTSASPARIPTRCRCASIPAIHYTMGGLWVDYNLMTTIPGLYVIGEANFSDHGANRLGASALMQGLADGYFVLPYTIGDYLASHQVREGRRDRTRRCARRKPRSARVTKRLLEIKGTRTVDSFHRELGKIMWDYCGMARNAAGPEDGARRDSRAARAVLAATSRCSGTRRGAEPVAREGRPRGRLLRARPS